MPALKIVVLKKIMRELRPGQYDVTLDVSDESTDEATQEILRRIGGDVIADELRRQRGILDQILSRLPRK